MLLKMWFTQQLGDQGEYILPKMIFYHKREMKGLRSSKISQLSGRVQLMHKCKWMLKDRLSKRSSILRCLLFFYCPLSFCWAIQLFFFSNKCHFNYARSQYFFGDKNWMKADTFTKRTSGVFYMLKRTT